MDSILVSVKKALGITEEYEHFDQDIIMHVNSALATLTQLGVGPATGFAIYDASADWSDFVEDTTIMQMIKSYVYLKVRILFDPPQSSAVIDCINKQLTEYEWRINVLAENKKEETESEVIA